MSVVRVTMTYVPTGAMVMEKRFVLEDTIGRIKDICATHFQTSADNMRLSLKDDAGTSLESDMRNEKMLGYYQVKDAFAIDVHDTQNKDDFKTNFVDYNDVSKVEKFEIAEDDYAKREQSGRAFREQCMAQQQAEMLKAGVALPTELHAESYKEAADKMKVGDRCEVFPGDRLGEVKYVGRCGGLKAGYWIGVEYDEPVGKNNGSAGGHVYFTCNPGYGGFVRPEHVTVGDFPPEEF
jgi:tubulin-folding cofactor B